MTLCRPSMEITLAFFVAAFQVLKESNARLLHDNMIMEEPHIMCMERSIGLAVKTRDPFFGRMFVNGLTDQEGCVRQFNSQYNNGQFEIPFASCDMRMQRVMWPQPAMEYSTTMIVSFHSDLLTETDRVFHVKCRYFQQDKSIGSFFEVSMLPTILLTSNFPVPNCRYTLHVNAADGPEAQFARIGDPVYHRWECDSEMYGMKVKSCFVDDGRKRRYLLIDSSGCSADNVILPDITYDNSLRTAFVQTHVFKFADRAHVFFQCQISLCLKESGACLEVTPPNCARLRYKRSLNNGSLPPEDEDEDVGGALDLSSSSLVVLDIGDGKKFDDYVKRNVVDSCTFCLPSYGFGALIGCNILTLTIATVTTMALCRRQNPVSALQKA